LISNDTRDEKTRAEEIYKTIKSAISIAKKDSSIKMSTLQGNFVIPLTRDNYKMELRKGTAQDTSEINITVKTAIPQNIKNPTKLVEKLKKFAKSVPVSGRVKFTVLSDVDVSVVDPNQYRHEILGLISKDISFITGKPGDDYRVVLEGVHKPVEWRRAGRLHLSLYVPYSYAIIPLNITTIIPNEY